MIEKLRKLGMTLNLVQTANGEKHYTDAQGNRLILYPDGTHSIEEAAK